MNALAIFLAHTLIGFYFVFFGVWNVYHWSTLIDVLLTKKIPHPILILAVGIAWQVTAGILIMLGVLVTLAALSLVPFTLISIFIFHSFWSVKGETKKLHFTIFITHLTVTLGALLLL